MIQNLTLFYCIFNCKGHSKKFFEIEHEIIKKL